MDGARQARRSQRPLGLPAAHLPLRTYLSGILGAIILGVGLSCLLGLRHSGGSFVGGHPWVFMSPGDVVRGALMFFSPGITILSLMLFSILKDQWWLEYEADAKLVGYGALIGMLLGLINIPMYLWWLYMPKDWAHIGGIQLVAGASGGAWIGHQISLAVYPRRRFSPRKALGVLASILVVLGMLLWLYSPHKAESPAGQEAAAGTPGQAPRPGESSQASRSQDVRPSGGFQVSPIAIDLGNLEMGASAPSPTISVTALEAITDLSVVATGEDVSIEPISSCTSVLRAGAKCVVIVKFVPRSPGRLMDGIIFNTRAMRVIVPIKAVGLTSP
jgi:hypothetical protein